jgi:hypothetical protein
MVTVTHTAATGTATSNASHKELPARIVRNASGEFVCGGRLPVE